jgi:hypothetical protein
MPTSIDALFPAEELARVDPTSARSSLFCQVRDLVIPLRKLNRSVCDLSRALARDSQAIRRTAAWRKTQVANALVTALTGGAPHHAVGSS